MMIQKYIYFEIIIPKIILVPGGLHYIIRFEKKQRKKNKSKGPEKTGGGPRRS
jgi:hypothetical protein